MSVQDLIGAIQAYNPDADRGVVEQAYRFSAKVHKGQKRASGEPYLTHPLAVAIILAEMHLDTATVITGLLHDTVEDTLATLDELREEFGGEVAALVDGVTKISLMEAGHDEEGRAEAESVRKMFLASARDARVLLVKLADRTHNMRTIDHLDGGKQARVARETLELYAPLAHRLGIQWLKTELEETAFRVIWSQEHQAICERLAEGRAERQGYINEVSGLLAKQLEQAGLEAEISGRPKTPYSIFRKMEKQDIGYDELHDLVAFRCLVDSERDCYDALGLVHANWRPVPGRFRDYVALPKTNLYQSLHTTVIGPYGERMEVQVRTHEMHRVAEHGVAAHWRYKGPHPDNGTAPAIDGAEHSDWLQRLLESPQQVDDPRQFLDAIKEDLFADEIVVFTPKGEPLSFPKGHTAVDFAYRIHSDIGDHCAGARVNGQLVPLRYQLQPGDTVEVITTEDQQPVRDWLKFVRSGRARARITAKLRQVERRKAIALGREMLERDLARQQLDLARLRREGRMAELLKRFKKADEDALCEAVGFGRTTARQVIEFLLPGKGVESVGSRSKLKTLFGFLERRPRQGVAVAADEDLVVRFGKCCEPLPGEGIVGFITRGSGVTVHAVGCQRFADANPERRVEVSWEKGARAPRRVKIQVTSRDRPGMLAGMSQAIAAAGVNIDKVHTKKAGESGAMNLFELTLFNVDELQRIERNLRRVPGVKAVERVRT